MTQPHSAAGSPGETVSALRAAMREARIEAAERSGVIVDLHDAQLARLEILNEALDPIFAAIPDGVDVCERGISAGDPPRLWVDMVAHVVMAHDKRVYRFLQDTRYGRKVLAESTQVDPIVKAVTRYVARRLVERERALAGEGWTAPERGRAWRWRAPLFFALGLVTGIAALFAIAWLMPRP